MTLTISEINSGKDLDAFIRFPDLLYKGSQYYIPALHANQRSTLSPEKNPAFEHCEARYWLALSGHAVVGRIAGIINHRYNQERGVKYIRMGWLDFVKDDQVLKALLQKVEAWGREKGMEYIHGPLGFNSFDPSGVLIEGYDEWPTSFGHYNFAYYDPMLQKAGYQKEVDWVEYNIKVPPKIPDKMAQLTQLIKKRYGVRNAVLKSRRDLVRHAPAIFGLINEVYQGLYGFSTLTDAEIEAITNDFLSMIHPGYVSVILNEQDQLVAFGIVMPSLSRALKKAGGRLFPFGILRMMWALRFNDTVDMLLIGVRPDYQGKGIHALIFEKIVQTFHQRGIRQVETTRELENNGKVRQIWEGYEPRLHKRARAYIKALL